MVNKIRFNSGREKLSGLIITPKTDVKPDFLFLHGGGSSGKDRVLYLAELLAKSGTASLSFDHTGSGESPGNTVSSSLGKRVDEALAAVKMMDSKDLTVCGSSMGAYIAVKLIEIIEVKNLILFCPAVYDKNAFDLGFGGGFTECIRKKDSWRNTDAFGILKNFKGHLLIFTGDKDEVIPPDIINLIDTSSINVNKKEIVTISGCPHQMHSWLSAHPEQARTVAQNISYFLNKD